MDPLLEYITRTLQPQDGKPEVLFSQPPFLLLKILDGKSWNSLSEMDHEISSIISSEIQDHHVKHNKAHRKLKEKYPDKSLAVLQQNGSIDLDDEETREYMEKLLVHASYIGQYIELRNSYPEIMSSLRN